MVLFSLWSGLLELMLYIPKINSIFVAESRGALIKSAFCY